MYGKVEVIPPALTASRQHRLKQSFEGFSDGEASSRHKQNKQLSELSVKYNKLIDRDEHQKEMW